MRSEELPSGAIRSDSPDDAVAVVNEAFYVACRNGHTDVARFLLEQGAAPDARGFFGGTGLHWAAINGHAETVRMLLGAGADPYLKDERWESTPLGYAREGKQEEIVALLRGVMGDGR